MAFIVFGLTSAICEQKSSLVISLRSTVLHQPISDEFDCRENVPASFVITQSNVTELHDFTNEVQVRLCQGFEESVVAVIRVNVILSKHCQSKFMA